MPARGGEEKALGRVLVGGRLWDGRNFQLLFAWTRSCHSGSPALVNDGWFYGVLFIKDNVNSNFFYFFFCFIFFFQKKQLLVLREHNLNQDSRFLNKTDMKVAFEPWCGIVSVSGFWGFREDGAVIHKVVE